MPKTTLDGSSNRRALFWPEWSETDIASEKWDTVGKRKDAKKTAEQMPLFEDFEGQSAFPPGQVPFRLIRATDYFGVKPVIKSGNRINGNEIMQQNGHLLTSAQNQPLLPVSENPGELWLLLLTKALLKVALLSADPSESFSTIHSLTGWLPQRMFLKSSPWGTWNYLNGILPSWKRGENSQKSTAEPRISDALMEKSVSSPSKVKSKDSDQTKPQAIIDDNQKLIVAFGREKDLSEQNFRNVAKKDRDQIHGLLKENFPKALVKCIRNIPLVPPNEVKPIPRWKSIRPRVDFRYAEQHPDSTQENEPIQSLLLQFCIAQR
nr:unnamed protein product [Spirometra erinaceieuropaei]